MNGTQYGTNRKTSGGEIGKVSERQSISSAVPDRFLIEI